MAISGGFSLAQEWQSEGCVNFDYHLSIADKCVNVIWLMYNFVKRKEKDKRVSVCVCVYAIENAKETINTI